MKKKAVALFLTVSISFTFFYPGLMLNDNVLKCIEEETGEEIVVIEGHEISLTELMKKPVSEKKYKLKLFEWLSDICN